jgi:hypothetical protein
VLLGLAGGGRGRSCRRLLREQAARGQARKRRFSRRNCQSGFLRLIIINDPLHRRRRWSVGAAEHLRQEELEVDKGRRRGCCPTSAATCHGVAQVCRAPGGVARGEVGHLAVDHLRIPRVVRAACPGADCVRPGASTRLPDRIDHVLGVRDHDRILLLSARSEHAVVQLVLPKTRVALLCQLIQVALG